MLYQILTDENGKKGFVPFNKKDNNANNGFNAINTSYFLPLDSITELDLLNHYIKKDLVSRFYDFDDLNKPVYSEKFENIDFESLFKKIFKNVYNSFVNTFFIDKDNAINNLFEGISLILKNNNLYTKDLDNYEEYWEVKEAQMERRLKSYNKRRGNQEQQLNSHSFLQLSPGNLEINDFIRQSLSYYSQNLVFKDNDINKDDLISKSFEYVKTHENTIFNNIDELKEELNIFIKKEDNLRYSERMKKNSYLLGDQDISISNKNIFCFLINKMGDLFYYSHNKKTRNTSILNNISNYNPLIVNKINKRYYISTDHGYTLDSLNKIENAFDIHERINNHLNKIEHIFHITNNEIYERDNSYEYDNKYHQIHEITYNEFITYFKLDDMAINKCLYQFIKEYVLTIHKINLYLNDTFDKWTKNDTKLNILVNSNQYFSPKYGYRHISIDEFNKQIEYDLNKLKIMHENKNKELCKLFDVASFFENHIKLINSLDMNVDIKEHIKTFIHKAEEENRSAEFLSHLKYKKIFNQIDYIILYFETMENIYNINNKTLKDSLLLPKYLKNGLKISYNKEKDMDIMKDINKLVINFFNHHELVNNKKIISYFKWFNDFLNIPLDQIVVQLDSKYMSNYTEKSVTFSYSEEYFNLNVLDYFLMQGNEDIVYFLKKNNIKPKFNKDKPISSLEYAILGNNSEQIIDWICNELNINEQYNSKVFGFLSYHAFHSSQMELKDTLFSIREEENSGFVFRKDKKINDILILEKMSYIYNKYHVNFNYHLSRLYLLIDENNINLILNKLGLEKEIINNINYSIFIKDLLLNDDFITINHEIESGRLSFFTKLNNNYITDDGYRLNEGILNLINAYITHFKYKEDNILDKSTKLLNTLLDNITPVQEIKLHELHIAGKYEDDNLLELLLSYGIENYKPIIKRLCTEHGFNLRGSKIMQDEYRSDDDDSPPQMTSYKDIYCNQLMEQLIFDKLLSDIEYQKINSVMNVNKDQKVHSSKKKRI